MKEIILNLYNNLSSSEKDLFCNTIDTLGNKHSVRYENNFFECSYHFLREEISFLNLNFYGKSTPRSVELNLRRIRFECIKNVIKNFNKNLRSKFSLKFAELLFYLSEEALWPIQFGFDLDENGGRIKLYLSFAGDKGRVVINNMIKLIDEIGLDYDKMISAFCQENFDALGIDLNKDGGCSLKLYTLFDVPCNWREILRNNGLFLTRNRESIDSYIAWINRFKLKQIGFLYRISKESEIESVKIWSRLSNPYFLKSEMCCSGIYAVNAHEWFNRASILSNTFGVKASYFVLEDNKPGIYFR